MVTIERVFTGRDAATFQSNVLPKLVGRYIFLIEREGRRGGFVFGIHSRPFIYICLWFDFGVYRFWKLVAGRVRDNFEWHFIRKRRLEASQEGHVYFQTDNGKCVSIYHNGQSFGC